MSHLRNLFHRPSEAASSSFLESVPAKESVTSTVAAPPLALPEFPVEEAHFSAEERLIYYTDPASFAADRYRLLRMRLKERWERGLKRILITGPLAREGKSTVTLNLATALSERGKRSVLVIEADMHQSSFARMFRLRPWAGLTECLMDENLSPLNCIRRIEPFGWHLLPAGEPLRNPTELSQTPAVGRIMQQLSPCFDWILVDSPPVVPLTDAISLQQHVNGTLLVIRAGATPREALEQTIALLGKNNVVGVVLNEVQTRAQSYYENREEAGLAIN